MSVNFPHVHSHPSALIQMYVSWW